MREKIIVTVIIGLIVVCEVLDVVMKMLHDRQVNRKYKRHD